MFTQSLSDVILIDYLDQILCYMYSRLAKRLNNSINCEWLAIFTFEFSDCIAHSVRRNTVHNLIKSSKQASKWVCIVSVYPLLSIESEFGQKFCILWLKVISTETFKLIWLVQAPQVTNICTQSPMWIHPSPYPFHSIDPCNPNRFIILMENFRNYKMNWILSFSEFILIDWHFHHAYIWFDIHRRFHRLKISVWRPIFFL